MNILYKIKRYFFSSILCFFSIISIAQPSGFIDDMVANDYTMPVGLTFDSNGRMFVWEKGGKVFITENGQRQTQAIIDISQEVLDYNDHGLNGFALDPNFSNNKYIYLLYTVKRHHALYYGTPKYDPNNNDDFKTSIGRLTRYTLMQKDGIWEVDYSTRKILIGESISTGIPILVDNHGVGSLVFSPDGTLLVSAGDVALLNVGTPPDDDKNSWFLEAVEAGIITNAENISAYRSQSLESLNGKILRIDPKTGDGISSNPFYTSTNPRSPQSRIWALGFRNPFRFSIMPNTSSTNPTDGKPGVLFVGDVGWTSREELNIVTTGGQNFGWPCHEGLDLANPYYQDAKYVPKNPQKPSVVWRSPAAQSVINNEAYDAGSPQFKGEPFSGFASIGGIFYTAKTFPAQYQNKYFHADYSGWIKKFSLDANLAANEVEHFVSDIHPTCLAINPKDGNIYYINYSYPYIQEVRKLAYDLEANRRPVAIISVDNIYGKSPLTVQFKGDQSYDPEKKPLRFVWNFGDGSYSDEINPKHTYESNDIRTFIATLNVTDDINQNSSKSFLIHINNTPPIIKNTSIDNIHEFENGKDLHLSLDAEVTDQEHKELDYLWSIILHHDDHSHFQTGFSTKQCSGVLGSTPCDGQKYWYEVQLKVSDPMGLSSTYSKQITPLCSNQLIPLSISPNPVKQPIDLISENEFYNKFLTVRLFSLNGHSIIEKHGLWQEIRKPINQQLLEQAAGIYLLNVGYDDFSKTFRIIKE